MAESDRLLRYQADLILLGLTAAKMGLCEASQWRRPPLPSLPHADRWFDPVVEDDMRTSITIAIIIAAAAITTAWAVSIPGPGSANKAEVRFGGGGLVPTHTHLLW